MKFLDLIKNLNGIQRTLLVIVFIVPFILFEIINYCTIPQFHKEEVEKVTLEIQKGATLQSISELLKSKGLIQDPELFKIWIISLGKEKDLKAGHFEIPIGLNYAQLAKYLSYAKAKQIKVTLLEGWQIQEIALKLKKEIGIDENIFINLTKDTSLIRQFGIECNSLEGYLLPETYYFYWGISEVDIIKMLVKNTLSIFDSSAQVQMNKLKMDRHEIITLASIIEGEAILDDERTTISSVYHNRLKRRMKLQADPTIQFILEGPPRRLLYKHLEIDSPYNTYKHYGLPPGPINNPGKKSLLAAIYPENTKYLYFVATGDGSHTFSRTGAEHARAKAKFNKVRKEVRRQKKLSN